MQPCCPHPRRGQLHEHSGLTGGLSGRRSAHPTTPLGHSSGSATRAAGSREGPGRAVRGAHLFVPLDLGVDEGPEDVGSEGQVGVDQLRLLVQAVQGEGVPQLHRLDRALLLHTERPPCSWPVLPPGPSPPPGQRPAPGTGPPAGAPPRCATPAAARPRAAGCARPRSSASASGCTCAAPAGACAARPSRAARTGPAGGGRDATGAAAGRPASQSPVAPLPIGPGGHAQGVAGGARTPKPSARGSRRPGAPAAAACTSPLPLRGPGFSSPSTTALRARGPRAGAAHTHLVGLEQIQEEVQLLHHVVLFLFALGNKNGLKRPSTHRTRRYTRLQARASPSWERQSAPRKSPRNVTAPGSRRSHTAQQSPRPLPTSACCVSPANMPWLHGPRRTPGGPGTPSSPPTAPLAPQTPECSGHCSVPEWGSGRRGGAGVGVEQL